MSSLKKDKIWGYKFENDKLINRMFKTELDMPIDFKRGKGPCLLSEEDRKKNMDLIKEKNYLIIQKRKCLLIEKILNG